MGTFTLKRLAEDDVSTEGQLLDQQGRALCFTLERGPRNPEHPRIVAGTFKMVLRQEGHLHAGYLAEYGPSFHKGMVQFIVPERQYIEFHAANSYTELLGCIAPGSTMTKPISAETHWQAVMSRAAYLRVYPNLRDAILAGETFLEVHDPV